MRPCTTKAREEFLSLLCEHIPHTWEQYTELRELGRKLLRYGSTYGRIQEACCNRELAPWEERKEKRIEELAAQVCQPWGIVPQFGGDPRGNTLKLTLPDGYTNDWGREGVCVPTS